MAITAGSFSTGSTPSTTVTAPAQAGVSLGDLMLIWVISQVAGMTFSSTGWTAVTAATGQNCSAQLLYKTATSADVTLSGSSGNYTVTASVSHCLAGIIIDAPNAAFDPSTPTSSGQLLGSAGTSFTVTGTTTTSAGDLILWFGGVRSPALADSPTITIPAGYASAVTQLTTTTATVNVGVTLATLSQTSAGATGNTTGGLGNALDGGGGLMVALTQPSGGGSGGGATLSGGGSLSTGSVQQAGATLPGAGVLTAATQAAGRIRHVGAALGSGTAGDQTIAQFLTVAGGSRYKVGHFFYGASIPASLAAASQGLAAYAGVYRALVDFELTHYGINGTYGSGGTPAAGAVTDAANLDTFIASCQAGGLDLTICLWHEPFNKFNTQTSATLDNLDYTNSMGYYGAVLRKYSIPVVFDPSNYSAQNHNAVTDSPITIGTAANPGLGWSACNAGYIDEIATDFYVNQQAAGSQGTLNAVGNLALLFNLPLAIYELGYAPAGAGTYTSADIDAFTSYTASYLSAWVAAGHQLSDIVIWATNDNATTAGMYLSSSWSATTIARYQALFDAYDGGAYGATPNAGTSALAGGGSLSAGGIQQPAATLTGTPIFTASGSTKSPVTLAGTASLAATGQIAGAGFTILAGAGALVSTTDTYNDVYGQFYGSAVPAVLSDLVTLTGIAAINTPNTGVLAGAVMAAGGSLSTRATALAGTTMTATGSLTAAGISSIPGAASLTATGALTSSGSIQASTSLNGTGAIVPAGGIAQTAILTGTASLTSLATARSSTILAALASLSAPNTVTGAASTLAGTSAFVAAAPIVLAGSALTGTGAINRPMSGQQAAVFLTGTGSLIPKTSQLAAAALTGKALLIATHPQAAGVITLTGTGSLTGTAIAALYKAIFLTAGPTAGTMGAGLTQGRNAFDIATTVTAGTISVGPTRTGLTINVSTTTGEGGP